MNSLSRLIRNRPAGCSCRRKKALQLEVLENRNLPSVFTVDHLADDLMGSRQAGSLRYCITNAANGDTVTFADGLTGSVNLTRELPHLEGDIRIEGPGADLITVRRDTGGDYRIFTIDSDINVSLSGMTISNGKVVGGEGGGIYNTGTLTISDCAILGNSTEKDRYGAGGDGGGLYSAGSLTIRNSTISGNSASAPFAEGGGISVVGTLTMDNSTISNNRASLFAISYLSGGTVTLTNCTIVDNSGGQACIEGNGTLTVSNSTIAGNVDYGIWNGSGTLTVSNSTIAGNSGYGIRNNEMLAISNSTITGNTAGGVENIAFLGDATATLLNCTIANNGGPQLNTHSGMGTPVGHATIQLRNTIISSDGHFANLLAGDAGTFVSQGFNLSSDNGSGFLTATGDRINTNPMLGVLQDNGGPNPTMALLAGSPALNAGDLVQQGTADQRGVVRSGGVNIGAYQASASTFVLMVPDSISAGESFDLVVQAVDPFGQLAVGYVGTVTFWTDDPDGSVPVDYTFTAADAGSHTFASGVTLYADGSHVVVTDKMMDTLTGSITITFGGG
jgi:hypothetical protein